MDARAVERALGGLRPAPRPFPPRCEDGRELCKRYMTAEKGCGLVDCPRAHVARNERPACPDHATYGHCARGRGCWLRHDVVPERAFGAGGVVLMADSESSLRHLGRCREILGADAVTVGGRTALGRRGVDVLLMISSGDACGTLRRLYEAEPHGMAKTRRTLAFPRDAPRASFVEDDEADAAMERWMETTMASMENDVGPDGRAYLRVRAAPKWLEKKIYGALDAIIERRGESLRVSPPGRGVSSRDCTHCLDAVSLYGRTFTSIWRTRGVYEDARGEETRSGFPEPDAPKLPKRGDATMDDLAFVYPLLLQDFRSDVRSSSCRAYFKLHEALLRAGVPVKDDWNCADIGAAPGGWTRTLGERVTSGVVWAIDPAELVLDPMPVNVKHLQVLAEDAVQTVREGLRATKTGELNLIVCDANMHPEACARIALEFAAKFASSKGESWLILSTKNFCKGTLKWLKAIDATMEMVRDAGYDEVFVRHLFSNCAEEKTLFARRLGKP